jgi:phosphoribosylformimino-5-aminoimidazole carboxamide ribotide isomerase
MIMTRGWTSESKIDIVDYILNYQESGVLSVICTDIEKDGMLEGPSFDLYMEIIGKTKPRLIASGRISSMNDIKRLKSIGCEGAIIGKAIYEGKISLSKLGELC